MNSLRRFAALVLTAACGLAAAQPFPNKPITLVHGFGAGGNIDVVARVVGQALSERLGQPVVVEPRTGAGGTIADAYVAKAKPDGYTLIMMHGGNAVAAALYKSLPYVPLDALTPIAFIARFPFAFSVRADSKFKTMDEVIKASKAAPDSVTFSSVGVGSTQHLAGELLQAMAGVKMTHVPYRGGGAPVADVLSGNVDVLADSLTVTVPQANAGKLRVLGVTSPDKWPTLADVPTVASVVPGYDVRSWHGIGGPKGMPPEVVERLLRDIQAVLQLPEVRERLIKGSGAQIATPQTPQEMRAEIAGQIAKWKKVVKDSNIPQQ